MSSKWRAMQHRHRYTYSAVMFPQSYTASLTLLNPTKPSQLTFYNDLNHLISLTSTYSQLSHAKTLCSSLTTLFSSFEDGDMPFFEAVTQVFLEILFLENSLPLHRTLFAGLMKVSGKVEFQSLIARCFRDLCEEYYRNVGKKRFLLSRVALSVMGMPKLGYLVEVVEDCAVWVAWDAVFGLEGVVLETEKEARPSPIVMEQCQESLSCLYYLLQRFPRRFSCLGGEELSVLKRVFGVLVRLLKSAAFSRDCFVAAGVALCAALQVCLPDEELGLVIIGGIFNQTTRGICGSHCESEFKDVVLKVPFDGNFLLELGRFSVMSRLCLIRGILTAISRTVLNIHFVVLSDNGNGNHVESIKTILYDGILPELCNYCENPIDSHFNFHTLTVMQICLQQMKTSLLSSVTDLSDGYDPISEETGTRVLRIIWNNLEDPLSQTVKQVHLIFDLFLDIQSTLRLGEGSEKIKSFLRKIASDLLRLGMRCKGRYVPLALFTKRLGAKTILDMNPDLLFGTVQAYVDDDVCCAATTFLKCFLEFLRDECWNSDGIEGGYAIYRGYCLFPFLYGLASGVSKLRSNLTTYALPVLLEVDEDSIFPMLDFISVRPTEDENGLAMAALSTTNVELKVEQKVAVLVSLLKVCRSLALIEGDVDSSESSMIVQTSDRLEERTMDSHALVCIKGSKFRVPVEWLVLALTHVDELLRVDAAESLFLNPKTASLPSHLELALLRGAMPLNMRSCSTGFQMKWTSLFRKFFSRVRTALERQLKQGSQQPLLNSNGNQACLNNRIDEKIGRRAEDLFKFMRWLCSFLFFSCYPSAPYKRKIMAMELISIMLNVWPIRPSSKDKSGSNLLESTFLPYSEGITQPDSTLLLVGSIVDSWDRLRENSFRILLCFPSPLPGISSEILVQKVILWAKNLVCSPRVRESDAGALTLRLIFRKYALELGWAVRVSDGDVRSQSQCQLINGVSHINESIPPVVEYIESLIAWLNTCVEEGERDLSEACKNSFVHGVLLTLRYTFEELDWNSDAVASSIFEMRFALEKLLIMVVRITSLALWVVSADAWHLPGMDEVVDDEYHLMEEMEMIKPSAGYDDQSSLNDEDRRPSEQIVMVGCWLAMKEVSLLLGTIIRKVPLPSSAIDAVDASVSYISSPVLDLEQLEHIGNHFLEVLLKMKHNGAIDKTRAGFTALCNRLLCSDDARLCRLAELWMEQLMERTVAKGQTVDDLLRRSAGIPAAFIALFLSEPEGTPKKLLPRALRWLIDVAKGRLLPEPSSRNIKETNSTQFLEKNAVEKISKIRDEGVVQTVHAFNVLRAAFNDTNLSTDTSGFAAEALMVAVRAFSSPYWEIRNSACLAYTVLVRRMVGFLNVQKRESARRALTGLEFFHRYPSLHPFLYNELKVATSSLSDATSGHSGSNLATVVHPSLCPILILLSRLKPSTLASDSGDDLDPFLFMPFIRMCSTQSNLRVRVLASRALTGLVSNEKLMTVLLDITSELPGMENQVTGEPSHLEVSNSKSKTDSISLNAIHGMLLQLSSLLDANCRNLADFAKKEKILTELLEVLATRKWIGSPSLCPCPILNASFVRVTDHMLNIARTGIISETFYSIRKLLLEISTECLDVEDSYGLSYYDPTIAELREQASISYFSCILQSSKEEAEEFLLIPEADLSPGSKLLLLSEMKNSLPGLEGRLIQSLSDTSYEVRLATLKWLLKFLKLSEDSSDIHPSRTEIESIQHWTNSNLQPMMMKLLESEKHRRCTYYILRILSAWNLLQFQKHDGQGDFNVSYVGNLDFDSLFQFWDTLVSLYEVTRHMKTRETLICCLAVCVQRFASSLTSQVLAISEERITKPGESQDFGMPSQLYECTTFFIDLVKEHSSSSGPVNMRRAAAESLVASGLLEQAEFVGAAICCQEATTGAFDSNFDPKNAVNIYAHQVLQVWFTCIKLLEDEDDGIRQGLAVSIQKFVLSKRYGGSSCAGVVPTQVEKVIELSFGYLSSIFGHWINYFDHLSQWVLDAAMYLVSTGDPVRRVFDKEIDNHHEEKLLICQTCCSYLENLPIVKSCLANAAVKDEFMKFLHTWRARFFSQLTLFAKDHVEKMEGIDWIGGVGNHKDAFLPLYANLLGFYAISNCILCGEADDCTTLASDVAKLGKVIGPCLRNPLIFNLYLMVVKSHENKMGTIVDKSISNVCEQSLWDGFDPYFLLR